MVSLKLLISTTGLASLAFITVAETPKCNSPVGIRARITLICEPFINSVGLFYLATTRRELTAFGSSLMAACFS